MSLKTLTLSTNACPSHFSEILTDPINVSVYKVSPQYLHQWRLEVEVIYELLSAVQALKSRTPFKRMTHFPN